jgi:hypothetical protein
MQSHAYNAIERALHHLALGSSSIAEISFDLNLALSSHKYEGDGSHVFVSGLARAGTTIIMRRLHETGLFRSLTYRDMPFVLCPNLWERLSSLSRRNIDAVERAHGDHLKIDADSPEALDEVFWRVFAGSEYIRPDHLCVHGADPELIERFRHYISCILRPQNAADAKQKYLSKNNNNILRLSSLQIAFPNSKIVIPFRDPVQHANSLLSQHVKFSRLQGENGFTRSYMKWLAHHEFGLEHRPFWLDTERPFRKSAYPTSSINYWLEMWLRLYDWIRDRRPDNSILVSYESLCASPVEWKRVLRRLGIEGVPERAEHPFSRAEDKEVSGVDEALAAQARDLYRQLRQASARDLDLGADMMVQGLMVPHALSRVAPG